MSGAITAVALDIGEVLVDETRVWATWAEVIEVPPLLLMASIGAAIATGQPHTAALERLAGPGWPELVAEHEERLGPLREDDLHPDARDGIADLRDLGLRVVLAGNQPARRTAELAALELGADDIVVSDELGAEKPDPAFFVRLLERLGGPPPHQVAYVGDRIDNDVRTSQAAGLRPIWLRRGPWALLAPSARRDEPAATDLSGVVAVVRGWTAGDADDTRTRR